MFERFTEPSRQVLVLTQFEARPRGREIGTEHILLGLVMEERGLAARVLRDAGVTADGVKARLPRPGEDFLDQMPFTGEVVQALKEASTEATALGHHWIGTEHLLIGLARLGSGRADEILRDIGVNPDDLRAQVIATISGADPPGAGPRESGSSGDS